MSTPPSSLAQQQLYGALRTTLITYGVAAFAWLQTRPIGVGAPGALGTPGGTGSSQRYLLLGVASQVLMIFARRLVTRFVPDAATATQVTGVLELVADGVTVLLFALGTFGAIGYFGDAVSG